MSALWNERSPSERRVLIAGGAIVLALLLIALVWLPLERNRKRLDAELPRLAASVAAMERQAAEVARVRSIPATVSAAAAPLATVAGNLGRAVPGAQISPIDDKRLRITGADVPYGALLETIAAAQASHAMRVDSARIDALPAAGRVRAELVLSRP